MISFVLSFYERMRIKIFSIYMNEVYNQRGYNEFKI